MKWTAALLIVASIFLFWEAYQAPPSDGDSSIRATATIIGTTALGAGIGILIAVLLGIA